MWHSEHCGCALLGCGLEPSWNKNGRVAAAAAAGAAPVDHWCGLAPGAGGVSGVLSAGDPGCRWPLPILVWGLVCVDWVYNTGGHLVTKQQKDFIG